MAEKRVSGARSSEALAPASARSARCALRLRIASFEEFWPFYLGEHSKPATRWFHFVGTTISMVLIALGIAAGSPWLFAVAIAEGYALSWISHFFIERNRPASWTYPLWSFAADLKLWSLMIQQAWASGQKD